MTTEVMDRLNLTSSEASDRIGRAINNRYRRVTSSIGMELTRRVTVSNTATIGNRTITFEGVEKLINVTDRSDTPYIILDEVTNDEMIKLPIRSDPPRNYAIVRYYSNAVDIYLDSIPATAFTLYADAHNEVINLAGDDEPEFSESFHDVLIFGAMAEEYRRMEKIDYARDSEQDYERRLSDLRMWLAKSAYLDLYQGKTNSEDRHKWWLVNRG